MRIFKNRWFAKFADKENISDSDLIQAIQEANNGNIDADLGGGVIKLRLARKGKGKGKRGGYRNIVLFRQDNKAFFVYGFAKSERENINKAELAEFKKATKLSFKFSDEEIIAMIKSGRLTEVFHEI